MKPILDMRAHLHLVTGRLLIQSAMKQLTFMMDHNVVYRTPERFHAIAKINEFLSNHTLLAKDFYQSLLAIKPSVIEILPPAVGRYRNVRLRILELLQYAEAHCRDQVKISDLIEVGGLKNGGLAVSAHKSSPRRSSV